MGIINFHSVGFYTCQTQDEKRITQTTYYSFENYYVTGDNLDIICREFALNEDDCRELKEQVRSFATLASDFFACKGAITINYGTENKVHYERKYKDEKKEIFYFDFTKTPCFEKSKMDEEIKRMQKAIKRNEKAGYDYLRVKEEIKKHPELYIQGHTIYDFLWKYLRYNGYIENKTDLHKITKNLKLDNIVVSHVGKKLYPDNYIQRILRWIISLCQSVLSQLTKKTAGTQKS